MLRKTVLALATCIGVLFVSCTRDGDTIYEADPTDMPDTSPVVTVVYDPDALGDRSYNDLIYKGVEAAVLKYGLRTMQLSPATHDEGLAYLESFVRQVAAQQDTVRRLLVVTSTAYDDWVRQNNRRLEGNPYADLLYFETSTPLDGKGSTLYMPYYGAMYEAGAVSPFFASEVLLIGANPENEAVAEAMQGFKHGFATDYIGMRDVKQLYVEYIGNHQDEGFSISDSLALAMLNRHEWQVPYDYPLIVPICGGAGISFQQLVDVVGLYRFMGVDVKKTSLQCLHSAVKHIDQAMSLCIGQWLTAEGMPKHQSLGLASGYTEMLIHPTSKLEKSQMDEYLSSHLLDTIHEEAIRKEAEYEKK